MSNKRITAKAPARLCLFGEHQDYLGLPVIAMSIDLFLRAEGGVADDPKLTLRFLDMDREDVVPLAHAPFDYRFDNDFVHSTLRVLQRYGHGVSPLNLDFSSMIPVNSGSSSSTAMILALMAALLVSDGGCPDPEKIAKMAFEAEVLEFNAPGGMMDQVSIAMGGLRLIEFEPKMSTTLYDFDPGTFVLGNSGQPKNTVEILSRLKTPLEAIRKRLEAEGGSLETLSESEAKGLTDDPRVLEYLLGAIENRDLTRAARQLFSGTSPDPREFGRLLTQHQRVLARRLEVSTPKLDAMIEAAEQAGAYGSKINGSGGGGAMFAYAPENPEAVAEAINRVGGQAIVVRMSGGLTCKETSAKTNTSIGS